MTTALRCDPAIEQLGIGYEHPVMREGHVVSAPRHPLLFLDAFLDAATRERQLVLRRRKIYGGEVIDFWPAIFFPQFLLDFLFRFFASFLLSRTLFQTFIEA
jgi:hypothetical protein